MRNLPNHTANLSATGTASVPPMPGRSREITLTPFARDSASDTVNIHRPPIMPPQKNTVGNSASSSAVGAACLPESLYVTRKGFSRLRAKLGGR